MAEDLENLKLADDESLTEEMLEMLLDRFQRGYTTEDVLLNKALEKFGLPVKFRGENIEYTRRGKGNLRVKVSPKAKGASLQYTREFANGGPITQGIAEADAKLSPEQELWVASLLDPTDERMQDIERNNSKKPPYPEGEDPTAYRWTGEEWVKKSQTGFLGPRIHKPTGATMTEFSIGNIDNPLDPDDPLRPSMVSTLTEEEIEFLTTLPEGVSPREWGERPLGRSVLEKSWDHYKMRVEQGLSPFLTHDEESPQHAVPQFQDGGEVISDNQQLAQGIAEADSKLSPAQALWVASLLDPTMATGASDVFAGLPSFPSADMTVAEMFAGPRDPNFIENLKQGNYGTAVLQSAGMIPGIGMLTRVQKIAKLQKIIRKAKHDEVRETAAIRVGEGDPAYRARQQAIDTGAAAEKELRRINLEQVDDVREAVPEGGIETLLKKKSAQQEFDF